MLIENLFLCAGAMKSGTTWLYGVLDRHPSIYFSYEKEIHYFAHLHTSQIRLDDRNRLARTKHALQNFDPDRASAAAMRHKLLWYGNYLSNPLDDSWYASLFSFRKGQKYCADFSNLYCHMHADGWNHVHLRRRGRENAGEARGLRAEREGQPAPVEGRPRSRLHRRRER